MSLFSSDAPFGNSGHQQRELADGQLFLYEDQSLMQLNMQLN